MLRFKLLFLTIVLTPIGAFSSNAPLGHIVKDADAIVPSEKTEVIDNNAKPEDMKGLSIGQPPNKKNEAIYIQPDRPFPYNEGLGGYLGVAIDKEDDDFKFPIVLGFFYRKYLFRKYEVEFSAALQDNSKGTLSADYMYYINRSLLRVYAKLGASVFVIGEEKLATFSNIDNFRANFAIGMEDLLAAPLSFKIESGARVGLGGVNGYLIIGYSWAW